MSPISAGLTKALLAAMLTGLSSGAIAEAAQAKATPVARATVKTEYFDLTTAEYRLGDQPQRAGGALAVDGDGVIVASPDGDFARLDPMTWTYQAHYLPSLPDLGGGSIKFSKRYGYQELLPRVHGTALLDDILYASYDQYRPGDDSICFVISKISLRSKRWTEVYRSPVLDTPYYPLGGGGAMVASEAEGRLYFTVGDYSLDRINHLPSDVAPQNPALPFGKVNYIDLKDGSYHLFTLGHRNQLGLAILADGRLLESENGPRGGDELNVLAQGKNYGWPYESYGTRYDSYQFYGDTLSPHAGQTYEQPIYVWTPSIAPTQLTQVVHFDPNWDGNVLLGSLEAKSLYNIKLAGERVVYCEPILVGARIRDLKQFRSSFLLLTDSGTIVEVKKAALSSPFARPDVTNVKQ